MLCAAQCASEALLWALQVLNTIFFLTGYLGFLATWIMDTIQSFVRK